MRKDYDTDNNNWYWAHYSADGNVITTSKTSGPFDKGDFVTFEEEGRLWVFHLQDEALADFVSKGELAKHVIRPGIGPRGMTLKSNESDTITHYLIQKEGFAVTIEDGRLWVFADGSESHNSFLEHGEPAKCVVFPAAGPIGMTVKGADADVINAYLRSK